MELMKFSAEELSELEALEIKGGGDGFNPSQFRCSNTAAGCGAGVAQEECTNNATGCGSTIITELGCSPIPPFTPIS